MVSVSSPDHLKHADPKQSEAAYAEERESIDVNIVTWDGPNDPEACSIYLPPLVLI